MSTEKNSELILLRLPPSLDQRLRRTASRLVIGRQHIIRSAITTELALLDARAAGITPTEAKALIDYRKLTGGDPIALLKSATRAHLQAG